MEFQIEKVSYKDGSVRYIPQYRYTPISGTWLDVPTKGGKRLFSLEEAKEAIDSFIKWQDSITATKKEYIRYP